MPGSLLTYCALVLGASTPCACWHFLSSRWMMNLVWRNIRRAFSFTKRLVVSPSVFLLLQANHHLHVFSASSAQQPRWQPPSSYARWSTIWKKSCQHYYCKQRFCTFFFVQKSIFGIFENVENRKKYSFQKLNSKVFWNFSEWTNQNSTAELYKTNFQKSLMLIVEVILVQSLVQTLCILLFFHF